MISVGTQLPPKPDLKTSLDLASLVKTTLRTFRVKDWYYHLGLCTFAFADFHGRISALGITMSLLFNIVYLSNLYSLNNYFDKEEDDDQKNFFRQNFTPSLQRAIIVSVQCATILIAGIFDLFWEASIISFINYLYSTPPFRLKRFLPYSLAANSLFFGFIYFSTARIIDPGVSLNEMVFLPYILCIFIHFQFIHQLEHEEATHRPLKFPLISVAVSMTPLALVIFLMPGFTLLDRTFTLAFFLIVFRILKVSRSYSTARVRVRYIALVLGGGLLLERLQAILV